MTGKKKIIIIAAAIIGILLMVLPGLFQKSEKEEEKKETVYYSKILEEKLTSLLESAEGVGKAQVVVTLDSSTQSVFATNEKTSDGSSAIEYVIINGKDSDEPVPVKEIYPRVRGVAVVCSGGGSAEIKKRITELISAALGIPANKIAVSG